jgi:hypothetical protein
MTRKKLNQIRASIAAARRRSNTFADLAGIAQALGRKRAKGAQARGKEPAFISTVFVKIAPITIPYHGKDIKTGTAKNILNQLEDDVLRFERLLEEQRRAGNGYENGEDRD